MDNRQAAMCGRLENRLVMLLTQDKSWQDSAEEIAAGLELDNPDLSSPAKFVASAAPRLPALAREAVSRRMNPDDLNKSSSATELVNNLLP